MAMQESVSYQSIWVYYNPQHDSAEAGHKRMTEFSVECMGSNQEWTRVFDPDTQHAQQQFADAKSQWNQFTFDTACTSQKWKIGDFSHGSHKRGHTYVFEVKYSESTDELPLCTSDEMHSYDPDRVSCLPPPRPARIQGWCTEHQIATVDVNTHTETGPVFKSDAILPNVVVSSTAAPQAGQEGVLGESDGALLRAYFTNR